MKRAVALYLFLSACGGPVAESNESAIENQAESLERAANATTDQMIRQIEASSQGENPAANASAPAPKTEAKKP